MVVKTTTGGSAWTELHYGGITRGRCFQYGSLIQGGDWNHDDDYDTREIMAVSRSTDNGVTWSVYGINNIEGRVYSVAVHPGNHNIMYAAGQTTTDWKGRLMKTEDGGTTWSRMELSAAESIYDIREVIIDPGNYNRILAGTSRGVYISSDGGATWADPSLHLNLICMTIDKTNPDLIFAATYSGFYISEDGGASWTEQQNGLYEDAEIRCLEYDPVNHILYAGTRNGGVYTLSMTTGIDDPVESIPESLVLHQNYPNPFNSSTTISWTQPGAGRVTLSIYDIRGRKIRQLLDQNEGAGFKQVSWDGTDSAGRLMSSGIYLVKLNIGETSLSRKIILQK